MRTLFYSVLCFVTFIPVIAYGQNVYAPLVDIPGNEVGGFEKYINFLYGASISVAALLAVVKIIIAGAKYMLSDVVSSKSDAISDIRGAILGLLLILGAVVILEFINPQLIKGEIKFQPIPERPDIRVNAPVTVNGTTMDEEQGRLTAGVAACVSTTPGATSPGGYYMVYGANASGCSYDEGLASLTAFALNCVAGKGTPVNRGTGSKIVGCSIPIQNAGARVAAAKAAEDELAYIKKTFLPQTDADGDGRRDFFNQSIPDAYITRNNNTISIAINRFCEDSYTTGTYANLSASQKRAGIDDCSRDSGGSWSGRISGRCETAGGRATLSGGTLTCSMPVEKVPVSKLEVADNLVGPRPPKDWAEMKKACGNGTLVKTNGLAPQTFDGLFGGLTPSDYTCIRY